MSRRKSTTKEPDRLIGERVKQARQEAGETLDTLAVQLGHGITALWAKEKGNSSFTAYQFYRLAKHFKKPMHWFTQDID